MADTLVNLEAAIADVKRRFRGPQLTVSQADWALNRIRQLTGQGQPARTLDEITYAMMTHGMIETRVRVKVYRADGVTVDRYVMPQSQVTVEWVGQQVQGSYQTIPGPRPKSGVFYVNQELDESQAPYNRLVAQDWPVLAALYGFRGPVVYVCPYGPPFSA